MSFSNSINSAEKYFSTLEDLLIRAYWADPMGRVDPAIIYEHFTLKGLQLRSTAVRAHRWTLDKVAEATLRWQNTPWNAAQNQKVFLEFLKEITLEKYLREARYDILVAALTRWTERAKHYLHEGDENSRIFCEHKAEMTAIAISTGKTVKELEDDPDVQNRLWEDLGGYNSRFLAFELAPFINQDNSL